MPGSPGTVEFIRAGSREEIERELGEHEVAENQPWMLRTTKSRTDWRL